MTDILEYNFTRGEAYMNAKQLTHFKAILNAQKTRIMEEATRTVDHLQTDPTHYPDVVDSAAQEEEFTIELRTRDRERKLLRKIEKTLENIEKGEYGYCDKCDAEIGIRRLEARPTATQCIDCKTFSEMQEKTHGK